MHVGVDITHCACLTLSSACSCVITDSGLQQVKGLNDRKERDNEKTLFELGGHLAMSAPRTQQLLTSSVMDGHNTIQLAPPHCKETSSHCTASNREGQSSTWHCPECTCVRPYLCIRITSHILMSIIMTSSIPESIYSAHLVVMIVRSCFQCNYYLRDNYINTLLLIIVRVCGKGSTNSNVRCTCVYTQLIMFSNLHFWAILRQVVSV